MATAIPGVVSTIDGHVRLDTAPITLRARTGISQALGVFRNRENEAIGASVSEGTATPARLTGRALIFACLS